MFKFNYSLGNRYFWRCMLKHTKRQFINESFYDMRCLVMFITAVCLIFYVKRGQKFELTYIPTGSCIWGAVSKYKMERQRWPEKLLLWGRSGTKFIAMVTAPLSLCCGAHWVEFYCQESNVSDSNCWEVSLHHIWTKFGWV